MASNNEQNIRKIKAEKKILLAFAQPLTIKHISQKTGIPENLCRHIVARYVQNGQLICLNHTARKSRVYWLTQSGILQQKKLCKKLNITNIKPDLPNIDWQLYGWVCFIHRSMVIKTLTMAMRPSEVKKVLRFRKPGMKISANNIRDVLRLLLSKAIVRPVKVKNRTYLRYELTETGTKFRQLLLQADQPL